MCLITFAYHKHPKYKLILLANRDEFYSRATRKLKFWDTDGYPDILAGKDLEAGGTWMGISKSGRWAALTNYRDPEWKLENPISRGKLVLNFLTSSNSIEQYVQVLNNEADKYLGYNILIGNPDQIIYFSNYDKSPKTIKEGLFGMSNALLDTPWPKLNKAKMLLKESVTKEYIDKEHLFSLLHDDTEAPDNQLPNTGIPYKWEKAISPLFIKTNTYGTRSSSILLIDYLGNINFTERRFIHTTGEILEENTYSIPV
jgi:uncharacterized protein with NRDE domain